MKKKILVNSLNGIVLGVFLGYVLSIVSSIFYGDGNYYPVMPQFVSKIGSVLNATIIQTVLYGVIGAICGGASVIWEIEKLGIIKQTIIYLVIELITILPIAYYLHWIGESIITLVIFILIFFIVFMIIWTIIYIYNKRKINELNKKLNSNK